MAFGKPLSTAAAIPIWKLAGYPVAEFAYPDISPTCQRWCMIVPTAETIAGELQVRPKSVGNLAA